MSLKKEIYEAVNPPEPKRREKFLETLPCPGLTYFEFVLSQICYIRKRMWIVSAAILLAGTGTVCMMPESHVLVVWVISALVPFLAVFASAEIARSSVFRMYEIETGCRFAAPQLAGARMLILGVCSFGVISAGTVISGIFSPYGIGACALYILTPYVCVCGISLAVFDRVRGQEGVYLSGALAVLVSVMGAILFSSDWMWGMGITMENLLLVLCGAGAALTMAEAGKILTGKDICYGIEN